MRDDVETISQFLLKPVESFAFEVKGQEPYVYEMKKTEQTGKCFFLKGENCSIYGLRPLICRFYPFELTASGEGRLRFLCTQECPGIGKGKRLEKDYFEMLFKQAYSQIRKKKTD